MSQVEVSPARRGRARLRRLWRSGGAVIAARWDLLMVIAAGGAVGSVARWTLAELEPTRLGHFPWATFTVNAGGSFLLGVLMMFVSEVWSPSRHRRPFLGIGVLGGFTTFSTYMLDTRTLLVSGNTAGAGAYLLGSVAAGTAAVWAGLTAVRVPLQRRQRRGLARIARGRADDDHSDDGRFKDGGTA